MCERRKILDTNVECNVLKAIPSDCLPVIFQNWKNQCRILGRVMLKQWARAHWTQSSVGVQRTDIDTGTDTRAGEGKAPTQTIGNKEQLIQKLLPVKHLAKRSLCLWSLLFNISEHMDLQQNQKITEHQSDWKQFWWLPRRVSGCKWESVFIVDQKKVVATTAGESRQIRGPETTKTVRLRKKCKTYLWNPIKYYRTQTNFSCVSFCIQAKKWFQLKFFINQCFLSPIIHLFASNSMDTYNVRKNIVDMSQQYLSLIKFLDTRVWMLTRIFHRHLVAPVLSQFRWSKHTLRQV